MKQLLSLVLAFQLMSFPVVAESSSAKEGQQQELADPEKNAQVDTGSNADYDARSQGGDGYENFAKQILGAGTAIIGSNILSSCKWGAKVPSILTFMGGAIAYLISEVSGGKKQNEEHKERLKRVEEIKKQVAANKGGGDVQRVLIEQRLEEEEKILEFVQERSKWGSAILAIYTIAAFLAMKEEMSGVAAGTAIGMTTCQGLASQYASPCGKAYPACYAKHMAACTPAQPLGQVAAKAAFMSPTSLATGEAACTGPYMAACQANLKAYAAIAYANCQPTASIPVIGSFSVNLYSAAFGLGMGYASAGNLQTLLQLAVSLTNVFVKSFSGKITALYSYPIPRSITFAAHGVVMGAVLLGLQGVAKKTQENIDQLKKVVAQFKNHTDTSNGFEQGGTPSEKDKGEIPGGDYQSSAPGAINLAQNPQALNKKELPLAKSKMCLSQSGGEMNISEEACKNAVSVNPIKVNIKNQGGQNLEKGVQLINDLNRFVNEGNMDEARSKGSQLASMANALRTDLAKLQDEYNKTLPKKDQINFAEAIDKQAQELQMSKEVKDIYDAFEKDHGLKLASFGSQGLASLDRAKDDSESQKITHAKASESIELPEVDALTAAAEAAQNNLSEGVLYEEGKESLEEEGLLFGGDKTSNNPFGLNEEAYRAASANGYLHLHGKEGYVVGEGLASRKENLFKIISNRYFLSYPKVMNRKIVETQRTE